MTRSSRSKPARAAQHSRPDRDDRSDGPNRLRIVGGSMRGRSLKYQGDIRVRPMKDRTREAVFNLLGPRAAGLYAWDLFAGTGAMGLEAVSRGAVGATLIERHIPTSKLVRDNVEALGVQDRVRIVQADAFHWIRTARVPEPWDRAEVPPAWLVFCCPPYAFYAERLEQMKQLLMDLQRVAPPNSLVVVEAEIPFDVTGLLEADWQVREYAPAVIGIVKLPPPREVSPPENSPSENSPSDPPGS